MLKELLYPFDPNHILENKRKFRKQLLEEGGSFTDKKIAILGGYTTSAIRQIMDLFLLNNGIRAEFYESEYNKFYEDAMFDNEELREFAPDLIYVCTSNRNIIAYPDLSMDKDQIDGLLENEIKRYTDIWKSLQEKYGCPIIQNDFELPYYRLMGNRDASDIHGKVDFINRLNLRISEEISKRENIYVCDIAYLSADYGLKEWSDPFYYHMYKYAVNVNAIPYLSFNVANIIKSIFGKNKKGFVLDLDNTIWGGVIGDDGVDGIKIGPEEPEGQIYSEFQRYLKEHKQLGVILNIDSKNDEENAIAGLEHPDSELREDDFVEIKANWEPKDVNFRQIAEDLSLLPESLVFVDDNPAERHIVSEQLKGVCAPELDMTKNYIRNIDRNGFFEVTTISADDLKRNEMYKENAQRAKAQASFSNYKDYLLDLNMQAVIRPFESIYYERIAQLSNKSNQYNLTTHRYTVNDIESIAEDERYVTLYGKLIDRFGDNGLVSVVIGRCEDDVCHIDLWIMSCRVLKRDLEYAMMDELVRRCKEKGIRQIRGYYYPTSKNRMVEDFYELQSFKLVSRDDDGNSEWSLDLDGDYKQKNEVIELI